MFCRDRFRTMINVEGDSIGAAIVAHLSMKDLEAQDERSREELPALEAYQTENPVNSGNINQGFEGISMEKTKL